jgi:hypothetical protein
MINKFLLRHYFVIVAALISLSAPASYAGEEDGVANYAYAVFSGTGRYTILDRTIYMINMPFRYNFKKGSKIGDREVKYKILLPLAIGVTDFENFDDLPDLDVDSLQTVSFVPGLEVSIGMTPRWQLKPFAQTGFGIDSKSDSKSFIWGVGVRTRFTFGAKSNWIAGGEYLWAGNNPNGNLASSDFQRWGFGIEYKYSTSWVLFDRSVSWHLRAIRWQITDPLEFQKPLLSSKLKNSSEIGFSLGLSRPIRLIGFNLSQVGIGYATSDGYDAVKIFARFPF